MKHLISVAVFVLILVVSATAAWADHLKIVYTRPDGGVTVVGPAPEFVATFPTEVEALAVIQAEDVPVDAADVEVVDRSTIPTDRWFRDAWTRPVGGGLIGVDMAKARVIQAGKIQGARRSQINRLLIDEDRARLEGRTVAANQHAADRASLGGMDLAAVAASIAGAANPTALKAIWPAGLPPQ